MRKVTVALAALLLAVTGQLRAEPEPAKPINREAGCARNPSVVGPCFKVKGRAAIGNGTRGFKIMQEGTRQILRVLPAEGEIVPACLAKAVTLTSEVTGEFHVCPFSLAKEGHMQMVCVDSVGEFTVRRWNERKRTYTVTASSPGCSLPLPSLDRDWRDGTPADVIDLVERYAGCNHWGGEEAYSKERRKEIEEGAKRLRCDRLDADEQTLRKRYAGKPRVMHVINAASTYEGD
jgi:hypothetical protein